jgi:hypothetical protein
MREICLRLLETYRNRGEILAEACRSGVLPELVRNGHVSNDEAYACIALYQNWSLFVKAERWNYGLYRPCPRKPIDALLLIDQWVAAGSPRALPIRDYAKSSIHCVMAVGSAIAQMVTDFGTVVDLMC